MRKPYADPFPNLPRRFGSFREVDTPPDKPRALTGKMARAIVVDDPGAPKPKARAKKSPKRKPKRKAKA